MKKTSSNAGARSKAARRRRAKTAPSRFTSANVVPPRSPIKGSGMVAAPAQEGGTLAPTTPALTARGRGRTGSGDDTDSGPCYGGPCVIATQALAILRALSKLPGTREFSGECSYQVSFHASGVRFGLTDCDAAEVHGLWTDNHPQ